MTQQTTGVNNIAPKQTNLSTVERQPLVVKSTKWSVRSVTRKGSYDTKWARLDNININGTELQRSRGYFVVLKETND